MNYNNEKKYVGHVDQLIKLKEIKLQAGKANGVLLLDIQNRSGLHFNVNISRGLDIPYLDYNGENFSYISPCNIVAPSYFDDQDLGFLKSFTAGFLTTCGLKLAGAPCDFEGVHYGLHGNISNTPAENVNHSIVEAENPYVQIKGRVRDAVIFGDKLILDRTIKAFYKEKNFTIVDKVTNDGYMRARHMILYHFNIGYPILSPESEIFIPSKKILPRDKNAEESINTWNKLLEPDPNFREVCFYHMLISDENNFSTVAIYNPILNLGLSITFSLDTLDHFVQWKMLSAGDYVLGLEPANSTIDGIQDAIDNRSMKYLDPQESVEYKLKIKILDNFEEFEKIKQKFVEK